MEFQKKEQYSIDDLREIMKLLRSENGCPWDREQTHESIRKNFLEETYEVLEAIDTQDTDLLKEELGDVLMQVVFHTRMEEEQGQFTFDDVVTGVCNKLITRHPHVFADVDAETSAEVLKNWDAIKRQEKNQTSFTDTLEQVPKVLPALMRAEKVQHRASRAGMDFESDTKALERLEDEVSELFEAMQEGDIAHIEEEIGDVLFSCVNISRFFHIDSEKGLTNAIEKFITRFRRVETYATKEQISLDKADAETLNRLWDLSKIEKK